MTLEKEAKIWFNGKLVDWDEAKIHVLSHVLHYGSSIFEGIRCYKTEKGPAIFRLKAHLLRMLRSCKIYRIELPYSIEEIKQAIIDTIKANNLEECYIRPLVFRGYDSLGVNPHPCPVEMVIATWKWGRYLGEEAIEKGVAVKVSSWNRMAPNTFPFLAKLGGNYINSQLMKMEALADGYSEAVALDTSGYVSEGGGENIFLVLEGKIYTPPLYASILPGITRDSVITLAKDLGYGVKEEPIPREMLYIADEVFFTGTAAEISPINSIDRIKIGGGERGPITKELQEAFFRITSGKEDKYGWLTFVK